MSSAQRAPTTDELLAMAYADGELSADAARDFEERLQREARLRVLVADQQRIAVLARESAPPEPLRLATLLVERDAPQMALLLAGRVLLVVAALWAVAWLALCCIEGAWRPPIAGAALTATAGLALLTWRAWNVRRATQHLDPYRDLRR